MIKKIHLVILSCRIKFLSWRLDMLNNRMDRLVNRRRCLENNMCLFCGHSLVPEVPEIDA
jgi:hypothetical protein